MITATLYFALYLTAQLPTEKKYPNSEIFGLSPHITSCIPIYILEFFKERFVHTSFIAWLILHCIPENIANIDSLRLLTIFSGLWIDKKRYQILSVRIFNSNMQSLTDKSVGRSQTCRYLHICYTYIYIYIFTHIHFFFCHFRQ